MRYRRMAAVASSAAEAQAALAEVAARYPLAEPAEADVVIALGGDGFMLETQHRFLSQGKPIYGMSRGTVGFLMNAFSLADLPARLERAHSTTLHPLSMRAVTIHGETQAALAINEVSMLRETRQAAKIRISVDGVVRVDELICDGVLVATPGGQHRLQPLRPRPHHTARRQHPGADADQRLQAAPLARRAAAARGDRQTRGHRARQASGQRGRRLHRGARRGLGRGRGRSRDGDSPALRPRAQPYRAHPQRTVHALRERPRLPVCSPRSPGRAPRRRDT